MINNLQEKLKQWEKNNEYSSWYSYDLPAHDPVPTGGISRYGRITPVAKDGFTFGNTLIFAGVGASRHFGTNRDYPVRDRLDPSRISVLCGADKQVVPFHTFQGTLSMGVDYTLVGERKTKPLRDFNRRIQRRVRKTSIIVSDLTDYYLAVDMVDVAPRSPDLSAILRMVRVRNLTGHPLNGLKLKLRLKGEIVWKTIIAGKDGVGLAGRRKQGTAWGGGLTPTLSRLLISEPGCIGIIAPGHRVFSGGKPGTDFFVEVALDDIAPYDETTADLWIPVCASRGRLEKEMENCRTRNALTLLKTTEAAWKKWSEEAWIQTSDPRLTDYLDSISCMLKCHEGTTALHLGALCHPHTVAYVRDNYWVQRALVEVGRREEKLKDVLFFTRAMRKSGLKGFYHIATQEGVAPFCAEERIELPACILLMIKDYYELTADRKFLKKVLPEIKKCARIIAECGTDRFVLNGDETWRWASNVRDPDYMADNSFLMVTGLEFAVEALKLLGEPEAGTYTRVARHLRKTADRLFISKEYGRYALSCDGDGRQDASIATAVICRPLLCGYATAQNKPVRKGVMDAWQAVRGPAGIRSHSRTMATTGNVWGYYLYALGELAAREGTQCIDWLLARSAATACVWELHDEYDGNWSNEKRRLWDTAAVYLGVVHYLFGLKATDTELVIAPNLPEGMEQVSFRGYRFRGKRVDIECAGGPKGAGRIVIRVNGRTLARGPGDLVVRLKDNGTWQRSRRRKLTLDKPVRNDPWVKIKQCFKKDPVNAWIVYGPGAKGHAQEVGQEILLHTCLHVSSTSTARAGQKDLLKGNLIVIGRVKGIARVKGDKGYVISSNPHDRNSWLVRIPVKKGIVDDTDRFIQDFRLKVLPVQIQAMGWSGALARHADELGLEPDDPLEIAITGNGKWPVFLFDDTGAHRPRKSHFTLPPSKQAFHIGDFVKYAAATGTKGIFLGLSRGRGGSYGWSSVGNKRGISVFANTPEHVKVTITITVPQTYIWMGAGGGGWQNRWERIGDPITLHRLPDGRTRAVMVINPGRPVYEGLVNIGDREDRTIRGVSTSWFKTSYKVGP